MKDLNNKANINSKFYNYLLSMYMVSVCLTMTVYADFKDIGFWGLSIVIPAGTIPFALTYPLADITAEVYGPNQAKKMMRQGSFFEIVFASLVILVSLLPDATGFPTNKVYEAHKYIFVFALSNVVASLVGKTVNIYTISKLKYKLKGRSFCSRSIASTMFGEFALSIIAALLSFSIASDLAILTILKFAILAYGVKLTIAAVLVKPIQWISCILKEKENLDVYDNSVNLNPFQYYNAACH